jgi:hypothetical protein
MIEIKNTLREQMNVKQNKNIFEKKIDKEQSSVWRKDMNKYQQGNLEMKGKTFENEKKNQLYVLEQIKDKELRKQQENEIISP